ncbi:MAG: ABC transporter substrate-binding protein [Proteobacteria bacterium]|nr:ABC transporter substrate-binding protein [Pseudomonadota bacterium]
MDGRKVRWIGASAARRWSVAVGAAVAAGAALWLTALPAGALETTNVVLGTAKDPNLGAEMVIAREKGYFRAVGLNVEVKYFPSGGDLSAAVVGGSVMMGSSGSTPTTTLRGSPFPIKILAQQADISGAQQLIVKPEIKKAEDLYGKKVALMKGTASELLFDSFAAAFGFDKSKVEIVSMGPTEMLSSFVRGDVVGINIWEAHATRARQAGSGHILVSGTTSYIPGKEGAKRIYGDHSTLFSPEDFVAKNPQTVRAVLEALARAVEFIGKDAEAANAILAKEFGMKPEDMRGIMKVNAYTMVLDDTLVADLNRLADFLHGLGKVKSKIAARDWIDPAPLRDVRAAWVTIK